MDCKMAAKSKLESNCNSLLLRVPGWHYTGAYLFPVYMYIERKWVCDCGDNTSQL